MGQMAAPAAPQGRYGQALGGWVEMKWGQAPSQTQSQAGAGAAGLGTEQMGGAGATGRHHVSARRRTPPACQASGT